MVSGFIRYTGVMLALGALGAVPAWAAATKGKSVASSDEVAVMETTKGRMVFEFWDKDAPKTVDNFKKLARQGFFDGTGFHRIIKGFMIQGGDPKSKNPKAPDLGTGDPGYTIPDEFNAHKHVAGVISMAHSAAANSGGSQFFIMDGAASSLDGKYTAFGHLIEGMNVLKDIASTPVGMNPMMGEKSKPLEWTTVKSVKIVSRSSLAKAPGGAEGAKPAPAAAAEVKSVPAAEQAPAKAAAVSETPAATKAEEAVPPPAAPADSVHKDGGH
jgi:peptidyl-prolyl cis-trans isomerase B (cyclophilin B)